MNPRGQPETEVKSCVGGVGLGVYLLLESTLIGYLFYTPFLILCIYVFSRTIYSVMDSTVFAFSMFRYTFII